MQLDRNKHFEVSWNGRDYVLDLNGVSFIVDASLVTKKTGTIGTIPQTIKNSAAFYTEDSAMARIVPFERHETRILDLGKDASLDPQTASGYVVFIHKTGQCLLSGPTSELDKISVRPSTDPRLSSETRREMERLRRQADNEEFACHFYPPTGTVGYQLQNLTELIETGKTLVSELRHLKEADKEQVKYDVIQQRMQENLPGRKFVREAFEQGAQVTSGDGHIRLLIPKEPTEKSVWHEDSFNDLSVSGIYRRLTEAVGTNLSNTERHDLARNLYQSIFYAIGDEISLPDGRGWKDVGLRYLRQIFYHEQGGKRSPQEVVTEARNVIEQLRPIIEQLKLKEEQFHIIEETGQQFTIDRATTSSMHLDVADDFEEEGRYQESHLQGHDKETDREDVEYLTERSEFTPAEFQHYAVVDVNQYAIFPNYVAQQDGDGEPIDLESYEKEIEWSASLVKNNPFAQFELSTHLRRYLGEVWGYGSKRAATAEEVEILRNLSGQVERHWQLKLTPKQVGILDTKEQARLEALVGAVVLLRAVSYQAGLNHDRAQLLGAHLAATTLLDEAKTVYGEARLAEQLTQTLALNPALQKAALSWPVLRQYLNTSIKIDPTQRHPQEEISLGVSLAASDDIRLHCTSLSAAYQLHLETERMQRFVDEVAPLAQAIATAAYAQAKDPKDFWRSTNNALEQIARQHGVPEDFTAFVRRQAQSTTQIDLPTLTDEQKNSLQQRLLAVTNLSEEQEKYPSLEELRPLFKQVGAQTPLISLRLSTQTTVFAAKTTTKDAQQKTFLALNTTAQTPRHNHIAQIFSAFRLWMKRHKEDPLAHLKPHERRQLFETVSISSLQGAYGKMIEKGIPAHKGREILHNFYREGIDAATKKNIDAKQRLAADPQYQQIVGEITKAAREQKSSRLRYLAGMFGGYIIPANPQDRELLKQYQALCSRIPQARGEIYKEVQRERTSLKHEMVHLKEELIAKANRTPLQRELNNHPFIRLFNGLARVESLRQQQSHTDPSVHAKQIAGWTAAEINSQSIRESIAKVLENGDDLDRQIAEALRNPSHEDAELMFVAPPVTQNPAAEKQAVHRIVGLVVNPERLNVHESGQALAERARLAEALGELNVRLNQMALATPESPTYQVNQAQCAQSLQKAVTAYDQLRTLRNNLPDEDAATWLYNKVFTTPANSEIIGNNLFRQLAEQVKRSYEHNCAYHLGALLEQAYVQGSFARAEQIAATKGEHALAEELRTLRQLVENPAQAPQKGELVLPREARESYLICGIGQACRTLIPQDWQPSNLSSTLVEAYAQRYVAQLTSSAKLNPPPEDKLALADCVRKEIVVKNDLSYQATVLETCLVNALRYQSEPKQQEHISKEVASALQRAMQCSIEAQNLSLERQQLTNRLLNSTRGHDDRNDNVKQDLSKDSHFVK